MPKSFVRGLEGGTKVKAWNNQTPWPCLFFLVRMVVSFHPSLCKNWATVSWFQSEGAPNSSQARLRFHWLVRGSIPDKPRSLLPPWRNSSGTPFLEASTEAARKYSTSVWCLTRGTQSTGARSLVNTLENKAGFPLILVTLAATCSGTLKCATSNSPLGWASFSHLPPVRWDTGSLICWASSAITELGVSCLSTPATPWRKCQGARTRRVTSLGPWVCNIWTVWGGLGHGPSKSAIWWSFNLYLNGKERLRSSDHQTDKEGKTELGGAMIPTVMSSVRS